MAEVILSQDLILTFGLTQDVVEWFRRISVCLMCQVSHVQDSVGQLASLNNCGVGHLHALVTHINLHVSYPHRPRGCIFKVLGVTVQARLQLL